MTWFADFVDRHLHLDQSPGAGYAEATVVSSNVNPAARVRGLQNNYDVVLDVFPATGPAFRAGLVAVELGPMLPAIGSTVRVALRHDGDDVIDVVLTWRGDPNLDLDAHRQQVARLAEQAAARRR